MVVYFPHTQKQDQKLKQPKRLYYGLLKQINPKKIIDLLTMKSNV